jgi:hypothetical protein
MPHPACSVCRHAQHDAIDTALKAGESVRVLAGRFGLSKTAVDRHRNHDKRTKTRMNIGQIERIDEEIKKLIRAQNRAKKKRDASQVLAISRELRNWFTIRQKAELACIGTKEDTADVAQVPQRELIALAQSLVESRLDDRDVQQWILTLAERIQAMPVTAAERDEE